LIAAFVRPQTGEGAQIAIIQTETTEIATAIANISQRLTTLQNNIPALTSGLIGQANGINDLARLCNMHYKRISNSTSPKVTIDGLMLVALLTVGSLPFFSRARVKNETIEASAIGTSTQLGQVVGVSIEIYDFSTPDDHQLLVTSLEKGQNSGLVNTLSKMKSVGHCFITGTLGYDASYIRVIPTPTGRKIRWVTNHQLRMGEVYADSQSHSFNLNSGEFDINDTDKKKSSGVLYPQCQLKEGQLQFQLAQNQWKLVDIIDWKGTAGVN